MSRYKVLVDDNFHFQDEEERREHGVYATLAEALAVCRDLVERSLEAEYRPGISADSLYDRYTSFGEDPFILVLDSPDPAAEFSAWDYARERCRGMCG